MIQNYYKSLAFVAVVVLVVGPFTGAVPTGAQTTNTATASPTPTAAPSPTSTATPTPTASTTATETATASPTTAAPTAETSATESTDSEEFDPDVVIEQWDDKIQVAVLTQDVPDDVESFEVRGATMSEELQLSASPPAGQGTLSKPATVEVVVVYEDGSESVIHTKTFE